MNKALAAIVYVSIMCIEIVRIAFMITALNDHEVKSRNILNAYVQAQVTE